MSIFQEASKVKLRFNTKKGMLSVEQLWDLSLTALTTIIRNLKKELKKNSDDDLSFLDETVTVDKTVTLRFEVAKAIYLTKKAEKDAAIDAIEKKQHNQRVMELIQRKKEEKLSEMSIEELEKLIK